MSFADTELRRGLSKKIDEHRQSRVDRLAEGHAGSIDKYWECVGFLRALKAIETDMVEIAKEINSPAQSRNSQSVTEEKELY